MMSLFRWFSNSRPKSESPTDAIHPQGSSPHWSFGSYENRVERCEIRLALSAMPWMPFDYGPLLQSDSLDSAAHTTWEQHLIEHDPTSPPSSTGMDAALVDSTPALQALLADAHRQTGWDIVQSQYGLQGSGQTVAIIDSGIAYDHYALGRGYGANYRVVGGWDFAENDNNPYDDAPGGFHGTHVAGIVGANYGSKQGVAPGVDLVALRVFNDFGKGELAWTELALRWVHENRNTFENPITTVNLSLGSSWNSNTVPSWGILEEELAQLQQDGITVVVSAGNSFQQYKTPGLAYPAASPYVIPVGSLDANQTLSDFSQRDPRMIAAPGRSIESTVPDYFYGKDGVANDWANSSGTSMSAPYVAGASVLIREAMEMAGLNNISPQSIYDTLRNTASDVFDSVTNQIYKALDLDAAIASIIPKDDVSDQWSEAPVRSLQNQWTTSSWLNTLSDKDIYRFQATEAGSVSLHFDSDHLENATLVLLRNGVESPWSMSDGKASFQVVAGETIGMRISDGQSIGRYDIDWSFKGNGNPSQGGGLPNFASLSGDTLTIRGNANANELLLDLSQGLKASVDGVTYQWNTLNFKNVVVDGMQNNDSIRIIGSASSDKIDLYPGSATLETDRLVVQLRQIENVQFVGGGGPDRAYLYDAATDDRLVIYPNRAELTGVGYSFQVEQIDRIFVHALQGGDDQAFVYDSLGNDALSVRPQFTSMSGAGYFNYLSGFERVYAYANNGGVDSAQLYDSKGNDLFSTSGEVTSIVGDGFSTFARGFEKVEAYSTAGGIDRALVYAPKGGTLTAGSDFIGMEGAGKTSIARRFNSVETFVAGIPSPAPQFRTNTIEEPSELEVQDFSSVDEGGGLEIDPGPHEGAGTAASLDLTDRVGTSFQVFVQPEKVSPWGSNLASAGTTDPQETLWEPETTGWDSIAQSDSRLPRVDYLFLEERLDRLEECVESLVWAIPDVERQALDAYFGQI